MRLSTANSTAMAVLTAIFSAKNQEKHGKKYGYSRINNRIFGQNPAKERQIIRL